MVPLAPAGGDHDPPARRYPLGQHYIIDGGPFTIILKDGVWHRRSIKEANQFKLLGHNS